VALDAPVDAAATSAVPTLTLDSMATLVATAQGGVIVVDSDRRYVYANPAACRLLGHTLEQLRDRALLDSFPTREHATVLAAFVARPDHSATSFSGVLIGEDGIEREVVCSTFPIDIDGRPHGVAVLWDFSSSREEARTALALAQTAAQLVGHEDVSEILTDIARHAVQGSRALSCGISVVDQDHTLASAGAYGPDGPAYGHANPAWQALSGTAVDTAIEAMTAGTIRFTEPPGRPSVVPDARAVWESNPITQPFAANLSGLDWQAGVYVPLSWENRVIGFLAIFLPTPLLGPSEADLALYRALADQAAVVVMNGRLAARAAKAAALLERGRLARELHDSVSQGLFSMTMHARAAQLALAAIGVEDDDPLNHSVAELAELTRGALAEMRALIFELRPGALAEEGLVRALRKTAAALAAREHVDILVAGPEDPLDLLPDVEEHLYRIATEAMNNLIKHSRAAHSSVHIASSDGALTIRVTDDGVGFDTGVVRPGHLGQSTMTQRAAAIGATFAITSALGAGTVVLVSLPGPVGLVER
jgi:PAS domain S-box-containing protein